ncbi:putative membrane protein [Cronobacter sakazakii 701]|nr:putative membrane protein [Cronobacter sakazakii 701]
MLYLLQLNNHQYTGGVWLISGAFIYGVLHAIGPGHGKFIVSAYLATHRENLFAARVVPLAGSLMQGVSAIAFVFILAVGFNLASGDLSQPDNRRVGPRLLHSKTRTGRPVYRHHAAHNDAVDMAVRHGVLVSHKNRLD